MPLLTNAQRDQIKYNYQTLTEIINTQDGLLDHLVSKRVITFRELETIRHYHTEHERVSRLLNVLLKSTTENYELFCEALRETGQNHVIGILQRSSNTASDSEPASVPSTAIRERELRLQIQQNRVRLKKEVDAARLLPFLKMEGFLTEDTEQTINRIEQKEEQMQKLLGLIIPKGLGAHEAFIRALKSSGFASIARAIEDTSATCIPVKSDTPLADVALLIKLNKTCANTRSLTIVDVPKEMIKPLKENSKHSFIKTLEHMYKIKKKEVQKVPFTIVFQVSHHSNLKKMREDYQNGKIVTLISEKLRQDPFFKTKDQWKFILDLDYEELNRNIEIIQHRLKNDNSEVGESDETDDEDGEDDDDDYDEDSGEEVASSCGCPGDGSCTMQDFPEEVPEAGIRATQVSETVIETGEQMMKKHEMKGRNKQYNYTPRDLYTHLLKNYRRVNWKTAYGKGGFTLLHTVVLEGRVDMVSVFYITGLLRFLYSMKVIGERSNYKDMTAMEMARKLKQPRMQDEIQKYKDLEDSMTWLHKMARIGDFQRARRIYERHPDLMDKEALDGTSPLYWAVISGSKDLVQFLVDQQADVFCRSAKGDTLLIQAAYLGHTHLVRYLVNSCGLDPDMTGEGQKSPLHRAIENGDLDMIKELVDVGAYVQDSCLPLVAKNGSSKLLKYFLDNFSLDINHQDRKGKCPLFYSVEQGNHKMINVLLVHGADMKLHDKKCRNVLHAAVESGSVEILDSIIRETKKQGIYRQLVNVRDKYLGADRCFLVRGRDNGLLAYHYVEIDRMLVHKFREITRSGGSLDVATFGEVIKSGWGAHPAPEVSTEIDNMYDASKVTPDTPDDMTPLCLAILKEKEDIALKFMEQGCDIKIPDRFGLTALHLAAMRGYVQVVTMLEKQGAQLDTRDSKNRTALQAAEENGHIRVVNFMKAQEFQNGHRQLMSTFRERMNGLVDMLDDLPLQQARGQGRNMNQYTVSTLRDMEGEINNMFYQMGTAPVVQDSQGHRSHPPQ